MANVKYSDKLYNEDQKYEFLSQYGETTQKTAVRLFRGSQIIESDLGKDLCEFTRDELKRLFYLYTPKSKVGSRSNVAWVSKYIKWSIENGYLQGISPLAGVSTGWKEQFVTSLKIYWTTEELDYIINSLVNASDAVIVSLLRNGVGGDGGAELLNLTIRDVDRNNNTLTLTDSDGTKRTIVVPNDCIKLCIEASLQREYYKKNGDPDKNAKSTVLTMIDNDFILKTAITKNINFDEPDKHLVHRRLRGIASMIDEKNFTPTQITRSGMLEMAKRLYDKSGELSEVEYAEIFRQFNVSLVANQDITKKDFLNIETLNEVYQTS